MAEKMKAAFLYEVGKVGFEEIDVPTPKPDEALVKIEAVGMCGSDVHYYETGRIGRYVVEKPLILGHECSGTIVEVGSEVKSVKVGDRVAVEPGVPCRKCLHCRSGHYNLCDDVVFMATPPVDGSFTEYVTHSADFLFPIPDNMTFPEGAMIEPLSVGMHATARGRVTVGDTVVVLGSGPIGLVTIQAAKARGASTVIATDVESGRLGLAEKLGASVTVNAKEKDAIEVINEVTNGLGADIVIETAGTQVTTQAAIHAARRGGTVVWVGLAPQDEFPIPVVEAIDKELDIHGIFRYANVYPAAIDLVAEGKVDVKSMITRTFDFADVPEAVEFAAKKDPNTIKIMVENFVS